jgi:hypothetical protein
MQETNRTDSTEPIESVMRINIPHYGIDLRRILLGLRYELVTQELYFSPKIEKVKNNVVIPTLRRRFTTTPKNGYLIIHYVKSVKLPIVLDGEFLAMSCLDVLVDYLEEKKINYPKLLPSPTHEYSVRLQTLVRESL